MLNQMVCFVIDVFSQHMSKKNYWPHLLLAHQNIIPKIGKILFISFYQSRNVDKISNSLPSAQGQQFCSHLKKMPPVWWNGLFLFRHLL